MKKWPNMGCKGLITLADIDALLFDMDGLLLDTERVFMEAFVVLCAELSIGQEDAERFYKSLIGTSSQQTDTALRDFLPRGVDDVAFNTRWCDMLSDRLAVGVPLRPGVADLLPALARAGWSMALVTSTRRVNAEHHMRAVGFWDFFAVVVAGDDVERNKPDPDPYLKAAAALGADPARCAAFEDSDTGTTAAVRAGCVTTQIPDLRPDQPLPELGQRLAASLSAALGQLGVVKDGQVLPVGGL